jgi:hypothetical protein
MRKTYHNFDEVDKDLRILNLRRQIAQEQVKGKISSIKAGLEPPEILSVLSSGMLKKFVISTLIGYVLRRFRR